MRRWAGTGQPVPECLRKAFASMRTAIKLETERRRQLGDAASVEVYESVARQLLAGHLNRRSARQ